MFRILYVLLFVVFLAGCKSTDATYVLTVDSTYEWLIPEYKLFIDEDPTNDPQLSPEDVARRNRAIETLQEATDAKMREIKLGI